MGHIKRFALALAAVLLLVLPLTAQGVLRVDMPDGSSWLALSPDEQLNVAVHIDQMQARIHDLEAAIAYANALIDEATNQPDKRINMAHPPLKQLAARLTAAPERLKRTYTGSWRAGGMTSAERGYGYRWQQARLSYLRENPLCVMCEAETPPRTTVASIVDHKVPHRGDQELFWDQSNWQSLCATHHSSIKQQQEHGGV